MTDIITDMKTLLKELETNKASYDLFKEALNTKNFAQCYDILNEFAGSRFEVTIISSFTQWLYSHSINPLNYINYIPDYFLIEAPIHSFTIPNNITSIGKLAFSGCKNLKSIEIPINVTTLAPFVFDDCDQLTEIKLSSSLTTIPEGCFAFCPNLKIVNIPYRVNLIDDYAFFNAESPTSKLSEVFIPESVTTINSNAFSGNVNLVIYCKADWVKKQLENEPDFKGKVVVT